MKSKNMCKCSEPISQEEIEAVSLLLGLPTFKSPSDLFVLKLEKEYEEYLAKKKVMEKLERFYVDVNNMFGAVIKSAEVCFDDILEFSRKNSRIIPTVSSFYIQTNPSESILEVKQFIIKNIELQLHNIPDNKSTKHQTIFWEIKPEIREKIDFDSCKKMYKGFANGTIFDGIIDKLRIANGT